MSLLTIYPQIQNLVKLRYLKSNFLVLGQLVWGKKALTNVVIPLARDKLPGFSSNATSNEINKFGRKRIEKEFTLLISNEDVNEIIKIIKSLEDSTVLIDGLTESVKNEIKKKTDFLELSQNLQPLHQYSQQFLQQQKV